MNEKCIKNFIRLINIHTYKGKNPFFNTTNFTFFNGVGFSKAWDINFPTGNEIFTLKKEEIENSLLEEYIRGEYGNVPDVIDYKMIREINYRIYIEEKYPEIRSRYSDKERNAIIRKDLKRFVISKFQKVPHCCKDLNNDSGNIEHGKLTENKKEMIAFFKQLMNQITGENGIPEGIRTNFITTNYDYVVEAIYGNLLNGNDFRGYFYRGYTPQYDRREDVPIFDDWLLSNLFKINGGFEIFVGNYSKKYRQDYCHKHLDDYFYHEPKIIIPSLEQNYEEEYFKNVFSKSVKLLQNTQVLLIVGYSFPEEDNIIRFLLRQFAEYPSDFVSKHIFYIDLEPNIEKIKTVFPYLNSYPQLMEQVHLYKGSFSQFCEELNKKQWVS